jgi:hypothetical protein
MTVEITIRDGRPGLEVVSDGKGVVLAVDRGSALDEGDVIVLADGTKVVVIGAGEKIGSGSYTQTVYIGSLPA